MSCSRFSFINLLDILLNLINYSTQFSFIAYRQSEATARIVVDNVAISDNSNNKPSDTAINGKVEKERVLMMVADCSRLQH